MTRLLIVCVSCGLFSSMANAADYYDRWLTTQNTRGMEIETIRVASEKPVVATVATDAEVASILEEIEEIEAIEEEDSDQEKAVDSL